MTPVRERQATFHARNPGSRTRSRASRSFLASACSLSALLAAGLSSTPAVAAGDDGYLILEEVVVTARKRAESLTEVPMHISAIEAEQLEQRNIVSATDLYRSLAGGAVAVNELILRGLSGSNSSAPGTTNQYVDGIPLDFRNVFDVEQVEVLRGPQGTLWGSNGIGGTVQIITRKPQLDALEWGATVSGTQEKNGTGTGLRGGMSLNVPLIRDTLALRLATQVRQSPGKVVNVYTGKARESESKFLRAQLLWEPLPLASINFSYLHDRYDSIGTSYADASIPGSYYTATLSENPVSPWGYDVGYVETDCPVGVTRAMCMGVPSRAKDTPERFRVYSLQDDWLTTGNDVYALTATHEDLFGLASATYVGSYQVYNEGALEDWSRLDMADLMRTWIINDLGEKRLTHELRFQGLSRSNFDWTVGVYFDKTWTGHRPDAQWQYHENTPEGIAIFSDWNDWAWGDWAPLGVNNVGEMGQYLWGDPARNYNLTYHNVWQKELAFFGELTYRLPTAVGDFEFTGGLRHFEFKDHASFEYSGIWYGPEGGGLAEGGKEDGNRKKFSVAYLPSSDLNIYALYSEGYRPGGNNAPLANACVGGEFADGYRSRYTSDSIDNYELGLKTNLFDRRLRMASAVYNINWTGVHAEVYMPGCGFTYTANAAKARSRGVEFESSLLLTPTTTLTVNASYTDATIRSDVDALQANRGDRMPQVPKYNAYLAVDQELDLFGHRAFVRADLSAYGTYKSHFNTLDQDVSPGYETVNLSGRVNLNDNAVLSLHLDNLFDKQYFTYRSARSRTDTSAYMYQLWGAERSVTLRMDYNFR